MNKKVYESADGRMWVPDRTHPNSDGSIFVCREVKKDGDKFILGHTAVISASELKPTFFTFG